ncbi:hypothetical protein ACYZT4_12565 [Pseudomonas sp. GB2N2]
MIKIKQAGRLSQRRNLGNDQEKKAIISRIYFGKKGIDSQYLRRSIALAGLRDSISDAPAAAVRAEHVQTQGTSGEYRGNLSN